MSNCEYCQSIDNECYLQLYNKKTKAMAWFCSLECLLFHAEDAFYDDI